MDERIFKSCRRAEKKCGTFRRAAQRRGTPIDLAPDSSWPRVPERSARMCVRVIGERMTAREYFGDEMRMRLRVFADDEKRGAGLELLEQIKQLERVREGRSVIDREPDFLLARVESPNNWSPPLASGHERGVKQKHVRNKKRRERDEDVRADEQNRKERRHGSEAEQEDARSADITLWRRKHSEFLSSAPRRRED